MGVGCAKLIEEHSKTLLHNSSNKVMVSISRRKLGNSIEKFHREIAEWANLFEINRGNESAWIVLPFHLPRDVLIPRRSLRFITCHRQAIKSYQPPPPLSQSPTKSVGETVFIISWCHLQRKRSMRSPFMGTYQENRGWQSWMGVVVILPQFCRWYPRNGRIEMTFDIS